MEDELNQFPLLIAAPMSSTLAIGFPIKPVENRQSDGRFGPNNNANPNGRPKGKTLKEYAREWYLLKPDEDKRAYLEHLEEKRPGFAWEMAEGKAKQDIDLSGEVTSKIVRLDE